MKVALVRMEVVQEDPDKNLQNILDLSKEGKLLAQAGEEGKEEILVFDLVQLGLGEKSC